MTGRTRLGIPPFDERYGGIYHRRPILCIGPSGGGKTIAALQFVHQGLVEGDRALILTAMPRADLLQLAERMSFGLAEAVTQGMVVVIDYATLQPAGADVVDVLPADAFVEVQRYVETKRIARLVLDPVLPWVAVPRRAELDARVKAFLVDTEATGATAFATLPEAVSPLATHLTHCLEDLMPVVFTLGGADADRRLTITRYLGEDHLPPPVPIRIETGAGIVLATGPAPLRVGEAAERKEPT